MTFLAIIIAVLLVQAWGSAERAHSDNWFESWRARVESFGLGAGISLALAILVPAAVLHILLGAVESWLFGLVWLLLAVALLLYSFGRGDFQASMAGYRGHVYSGDFEAAYLAACEEFGWDSSGESPDNEQDVHIMVQRALLYEGFQRWFAVVFYFALLGPAAAVAYRLSQLLRNDSQPGSAEAWLFVLDWVPARLLAFTFALTGDFISSRDSLLAALRAGEAGAGAVLYSVGVAALRPEVSQAADEAAGFGPGAAAQNREFNALLSRSAVCWVVVLSLLVLVF